MLKELLNHLPQELGAVMLVVPREERRLDHREEVIGVQLGGYRVHHLSEEHAHLRPVRHRVHIQYYVSTEPAGNLTLSSYFTLKLDNATTLINNIPACLV